MSPESSRESILRCELEDASQCYEKARAKMVKAEEHLIDLGGQHPDGAQAVRNATREMAKASKEYQRALIAFADAVMRRSRAAH